MKAQRLKIIFGLVAVGLFVAGALLLFKPNPYRRLERMRENALRLLPRHSHATLSDRLVGLLHRSSPSSYYLQKWESEQKVLLASGLLVETKIVISGTRSRHGIYEALRKIEQKTGAYWWATIDLTNGIVLLSSKPGDVASFAAALKNE